MYISIVERKYFFYLLFIFIFSIYGTPAHASACQKSSFIKLGDYHGRILSKYDSVLDRLNSINERVPNLYSDITENISPQQFAAYFTPKDKRYDFDLYVDLIEELLDDVKKTRGLVDRAANMGMKLKRLAQLLIESCHQAGATSNAINIASTLEDEGFRLAKAESRYFYEIIADLQQELSREKALLDKIQEQLAFGD